MQHPTGLQAWVSDLAGTLLPSIVHNGVTYCVATPGQEFSVTVSRDAGSLHAYTPDMLVYCLVDGQEIGYSKVLTRGSSSTFTGFMEAVLHHQKEARYRAFKFAAASAPVIAEEGGGQVVQHPDELKAGKIKLWATCAQPSGRVLNVKQPAVPTATAKQTLPGTKKFFMNNSLRAERGSAMQKPVNWLSFDPVGLTIWEMEIRYETADTLVLRQVLNSSNPAHHPLLQTCTIPSVVEALGLPAGQANDGYMPGGATQPAAGGGSRRRRRRAEAPAAVAAAAGAAAGSGEAGAGAGESPRLRRALFVKPEGRRVKTEGVSGVVDLTGEAPPLVLGGRRLARNEIAVCDLADSDDEAAGEWKVVKKRAVDV